jgi:hypothetical protein
MTLTVLDLFSGVGGFTLDPTDSAHEKTGRV